MSGKWLRAHAAIVARSIARSVEHSQARGFVSTYLFDEEGILRCEITLARERGRDLDQWRPRYFWVLEGETREGAPLPADANPRAIETQVMSELKAGSKFTRARRL